MYKNLGEVWYALSLIAVSAALALFVFAIFT
jgi:hypothetical protein